MGQAIAVRRDYTSGTLRRLAQRTKNAAQTCRLLAIAAVLDGASREEAAKIGGMDRQTVRDWVIRFNDPGAGRSHQHSITRRAGQARRDAQSLSRPDCGRWPDPGDPWCGALASVRSDHAVARGVWALGFRRHDLSRSEGLGLFAWSARPKVYKQDTEAMDAFKKTSPDAWRKRARSSHPAHR